MLNYLLIAAGGALGAMARYAVSRTAERAWGPDQVWGTLAINIVGGILMGFLVGWLVSQGRDGSQAVRLFAAVGVLGGFTTFSAFSLELVQLLQRKLYLGAFGYGAGSVVLAAGGLMIGLVIMRKVSS
ncbi:fluoride efflux transporter CrcB [Maricaulis sp. CAU 1757]